mgnify:CR=1 FL=1
MDLQNMDASGRQLQISTEVVGKIARCAALEVDGVAEVSCGVQNKKLKSLLESAASSRCGGGDAGRTANITPALMMQFGARIPSVLKKYRRTSSLPCRT